VSAAFDRSAFARLDAQRLGLAVVETVKVPGSFAHRHISQDRRAAVDMLSIRDAVGVFEPGERIGQSWPAAPQRHIANRVIRRRWPDERR
jgi:hypothetical protein